MLPTAGDGASKEHTESEELRLACFMGLVSVLASTPEVQRVSPFHVSGPLNAVGASVIQAATVNTTRSPLRDAGLDGTGEIIQASSTRLSSHCMLDTVPVLRLTHLPCIIFMVQCDPTQYSIEIDKNPHECSTLRYRVDLASYRAEPRTPQTFRAERKPLACTRSHARYRHGAR